AEIFPQSCSDVVIIGGEIAPSRRPSRPASDQQITFGDAAMRGLALAITAIFLALCGPAAAADDPPPGVKGLYLMADFPSITVRPAPASRGSLRWQNSALPPEMLDVSVPGVPSGWTASLLGGGQPVAAAMPATNASVSLQLRLDVPANANGKQTLTVT